MVENIMQFFSAAFYFICGWLIVLAVLLALLMLIFIINVTVDEMFHINLIDKVIKKVNGKIQNL